MPTSAINQCDSIRKFKAISKVCRYHGGYCGHRLLEVNGGD